MAKIDVSSGKSSAAASAGKSKKKWSKGKTKEKANNAVYFERASLDKMLKEASSYKLITTSILVDRLKINGSLARQAMREMETRGLIKRVMQSSALPIYTRATVAVE